MPFDRPRRLATAMALCVVLAGCGSTAPLAQQQEAAATAGVAEGLAGDAGLTVGASEAPAAAALAGGAGGATTAGTSGTTAGTNATSAPGATSSSGTAAAGTATTPGGASTSASAGPGPRQAAAAGERWGPGVTASKINIGVVKTKNAGAANESIGANVSAGDPNLQQRAMIKHINDTGGLAGRTIVPVEYELDENTTQTQAQIEQEMCETWTQDNEVFAAVTGLASDLLRTCMERAGSALVGSSLSTADAKTFEQFPHYLEVAGMRLDRMASVYPRSLAADGYFGEDAVVGVVTYDTPAFARATDTVLLPELARAGIEKVEVARIPFAVTPAELGNSSAALSNAVLRFRQEGVTHVMFLEAGAILAFLWFPQAESQGYRPRYGLNSQSGPVTHQKENEQLKDAVAIGWVPFIDVGDSRRTQLPPRFGECLKIMRAAGAQYSSDDPNAKRVSGWTCDAFWLLQQGLDAAGPDLTADGFVRGVAAVGGRFQSSHSYGVELRSRRDGASVVRPSAYNSSCECWRYSGPARPAPA